MSEQVHSDEYLIYLSDGSTICRKCEQNPCTCGYDHWQEFRSRVLTGGARASEVRDYAAWLTQKKVRETMQNGLSDAQLRALRLIAEKPRVIGTGADLVDGRSIAALVSRGYAVRGPHAIAGDIIEITRDGSKALEEITERDQQMVEEADLEEGQP